jgi:hypothetical protein
VVKQLADAFKKPLTKDEAESLLKREGEEAGIYLARLEEFVQSKLDDLVLQSVKPDAAGIPDID